MDFNTIKIAHIEFMIYVLSSFSFSPFGDIIRMTFQNGEENNKYTYTQYVKVR